ncbi:MAG: DUF4268 domain-containing protein [Bacteroidales bacterium]
MEAVILMYLIDKAKNKCIKIDEKKFGELGLKERENLQEWFVADPTMLGEELLIIQKEFDGFSDTKERLDLLALDKAGNLVVIENKLDDTGRDVVWQALKYASYCSSLVKEEIRSIFQAYLNKNGNETPAETILSDFYEKDFEEIILNRGASQRIILVAAKFRKEVTSTVLWLMNYNLNVQCFKVTPFQKDEQLFLDVEQIIPIKDAEEYIIKVAAKSKDDSAAERQLTTTYDFRVAFWTELLKVMNSKSDLFKSISPNKDNWIGASGGISGVAYNFVVLKNTSRVELYISTGKKEKNKEIFDYLFSHKSEIENMFGKELLWARLDDKDASRISYAVERSYSNKDEWGKLIEALTSNMAKFYNSISTHLKNFKSH